MEPRFQFDFSRIRVHTENGLGRSPVRAFTIGDHIIFRPGSYAPETPEGRRLLAHELTHVVQQHSGARRSHAKGNPGDEHERQANAVATSIAAGRASGVQIYLGRAPAMQCQESGVVNAGVRDAGPEPLPGGVPDETVQPEPPTLDQLSDAQLGEEYQKALSGADTARADTVAQEMDRRWTSMGTAAPRGPAPVTGGAGAVTPEVALKLLDNMAKGELPWKPAEGRGGSAWFTIEGNPYTATGAEKNVNVQVEIAKGTKPLVFREPDLLKIYDAEAVPASALAEAQYRAKFNLGEAVKLSNRALKTIKYNVPGLTQSRMWTRVGERVAASAEKIGEVIFEPVSKFSENPGKFAVVADASKITLKGGIKQVVDALAQQGVTAEPVVVEAAGKLAESMKWAGRVRNVFRYGGKVLIVVGVTLDAIKIYRAHDKLKAVLTSAAGWAGATAAGTEFAAWWTPADVAGLWAWVAHGVGTLVAGGIGYWIGSETTRYIYELAVE
jgi:hypothetical protein